MKVMMTPRPCRKKKAFVGRYNPTNKYLTDEDLQSIVKRLGTSCRLIFTDVATYQQAFVHKSYLVSPGMDEDNGTGGNDAVVSYQQASNETFEFLGDTLLTSVVGTMLYRKYPDKDEGFLTKTRSKLVRGTTLGQIASLLGLNDLLIMSKHVQDKGGRTNVSILEDALEAFIAAIYLDNEARCKHTKRKLETRSYTTVDAAIQAMNDMVLRNGYESVRIFIEAMYDKFIDWDKLEQHDDNYKERLQTYFQKTFKQFPKWQSKQRPDGLFQSTVRDACGFVVGTGLGRKIALADQQASFSALVHFKQCSQGPLDLDAVYSEAEHSLLFFRERPDTAS